MLRRGIRLILAALVAPVVVGATLVSTAGPATAAPCKPQTVADNTKAAMAVFTGDVTAVERQERPGGQPGAYFLHDVTVTRVYQGEIDTESVQVRTATAPPSAQECNLGKLNVGSSYVFMVGGSGDPWVASGNGGTAPATTDLVEHVERLLGDGRPPVPPSPEPAEFTVVATDEPDTLLRVAAPGLAMILVGVLGLLLLGFASRRS